MLGSRPETPTNDRTWFDKVLRSLRREERRSSRAVKGGKRTTCFSICPSSFHGGNFISRGSAFNPFIRGSRSERSKLAGPTLEPPVFYSTLFCLELSAVPQLRYFITVWKKRERGERWDRFANGVKEKSSVCEIHEMRLVQSAATAVVVVAWRGLRPGLQ